MKVKDAMQKDVIFVSPQTILKEVARIIFGHGINGLPVCKNKQIVGFITERDILAQFYPSMKDYMENPIHMSDFEEMESKVKDILEYPAEKIMTKKPIVVSAEEPLLEAQSLMQVHKLGRLPVVNSRNHLIGIISKNDIFTALVGKDLSVGWGQQEFHDWLSVYYNTFVDWQTRMKYEIPLILKYLKSNNVKSVLDVGCGVGEHAIALAKNGFNVVGIEKSQRMVDIANNKKEDLALKVRSNLAFVRLETENLPSSKLKNFDAAIIMGGVLAHAINFEEQFTRICKSLNGSKSTIVIQIPDYAELLRKKDRFNSFAFTSTPMLQGNEHGFFLFYDFRKDKLINLNVAVFDFTDKKWQARGVGTTVLNPLTKETISSTLKKFGYKKIHAIVDKSPSIFTPQALRGIFIVASK